MSRDIVSQRLVAVTPPRGLHEAKAKANGVSEGVDIMIYLFSREFEVQCREGKKYTAVWLTARSAGMTIPGGVVPMGVIKQLRDFPTKTNYIIDECDEEMLTFLFKLVEAVEEAVEEARNKGFDKPVEYMNLTQLGKVYRPTKSGRLLVIAFTEEYAAQSIADAKYLATYRYEEPVPSWAELHKKRRIRFGKTECLLENRVRHE